MLGFQINWLLAIAPDWTNANLLTVVDDKGDDGDALWDGILWAARAPSRTLYERLKPGLLARAMSPMRRRAEANVIGGFLLIGWGGDPEANPPEQLVTSAELREILVESDDELRGQILGHLEHWSADPEAKWRVLLFRSLLMSGRTIALCGPRKCQRASSTSPLRAEACSRRS